MTEIQWRLLCDLVTTQMNDYTATFVTPIVHQPNDKEPVFGTGTYLEFPTENDDRNDIGLLTCAHVVKNDPLQHRPYNCPELLDLPSVDLSDHTIDLALLKTNYSSWEKQGHFATALPGRKLASKHDTVQDELLFFRGISGENAHVGFGGMDAILSGYCSQEKRETGDDQNFEVFWEPGKMEVTSSTSETTQKRFKYDNAHGFSGSLVWNTRFVETGCDVDKWDPNMAVVTGLIHRWDTTNLTLLARRIEHVSSWLRRKC